MLFHIKQNNSTNLNKDIFAKLHRKFMCGLLDMRQFLNAVNQAAQTKVSFDIFKSHWQNILHIKTGAINFLEEASKLTSIYLVSDTDPIHAHHQFEHFGLQYYIKGTILSFNEGVLKPNRIMFEQACQKANRKPQSCLFIDDSIENVTQAESIGMHVIHYQNGAQQYKDIISELSNLLVF